MASRKPNVYTIEKGGRKKLIFQAPWFEGGAFAGLVELVPIVGPLAAGVVSVIGVLPHLRCVVEGWQ